ncbi:MAG: FAD:protein FMN transferase [Lachnospiraceae bacterium]|nr:FAD:protein FMN transferase [Lachnospiraceae bacterium]
MKKRSRKFSVILIVINCVLLTMGCSKDNKYECSFYAMDTYMVLQAYGPYAQTGLDLAEKKIREIEQIFSVTDEKSEIYKINHRVEDVVQVSDEVMELFNQAFIISSQSQGAFDVSIYPVVKAWGFTTGAYQVPEASEIEMIMKNTGYEKIQTDQTLGTLILEPGMEIDFGGIAKGYSADKAAEALKDAGVESAILSLGGNIQTIGSKADGSPWTVAVKDPEKTEEYMAVLKIRDQAVVTSGGYERYFEDEDGNVWWHIIDPATGYPAKSGLLSVTVIGESGMQCDALSTTLFVLGKDKAAEYWRTYGGFDAVLVTEDEEVYITEGIADSITLAGDYKEKEVHIIEK